MVRVALPRIEPQRNLRAELVAFDRDRSRDLDCADADHPVPRRAYVEDHARTRPVQAARVVGKADRRRGRRARLEVAVHLSGTRHRVGEPARDSGGHAGELPHHVGFGDELVLHPAARRPGLRDGRHADAPAPDRRRARQLCGHVRQLQRPRFLRHEVPHARRAARTVRRMGAEGEGVAGPARRDRVRHRRAAEREGARALLLVGRSSGSSTTSSRNTTMATSST